MCWQKYEGDAGPFMMCHVTCRLQKCTDMVAAGLVHAQMYVHCWKKNFYFFFQESKYELSESVYESYPFELVALSARPDVEKSASVWCINLHWKCCHKGNKYAKYVHFVHELYIHMYNACVSPRSWR